MTNFLWILKIAFREVYTKCSTYLTGLKGIVFFHPYIYDTIGRVYCFKFHVWCLKLTKRLAITLFNDFIICCHTYILIHNWGERNKSQLSIFTRNFLVCFFYLQSWLFIIKYIYFLYMLLNVNWVHSYSYFLC